MSEPSPRYYNSGAGSSPRPRCRPPLRSRDPRPRHRPGENHPRFGDGVIIAAEGSGSDARVQVKFAEAGSKWLMLAVAKLTPAS